MMNKKVITTSAEETRALGKKIGKALTVPSVVLLDGSLAAGKTTLTQGIAKGLGVTNIVNSPSFTIMKGYKGKNDLDFFHLDLYRLSDIGMDFDLVEYFEDSISVIEWPYQVKELIPNKHLLIKIKKIDENKREFEFIDKDGLYKKVLECII